MTSLRRPITLLVVVALAVAVAIAGVHLLTRAPNGPASSSYAVGHRGASGFAELLERAGHPVVRQRVPVDLEALRSTDTAVVLGGDAPDDEEARALERFVRGGGRLLVAGGATADAWVGQLTGEDVVRSERLLACHKLVDVPETSGVEEVESTGQPGFATWTGALPIVGCGDSALAVVVAHGAGRVVQVADDAVFQNFLLGARDNAAFALAATGGVDRRAVFLEHLHGFEPASGLGALPWRWMTAGAVLLIAGVAASLARRTRGATLAEAPTPPAARPRHEDALAAAMAGAPKDLAPIAQDAARRAIARAGRVPPGADDGAIRAVAAALGLPESDTEFVLSGAPDRATVLAATRTLERVSTQPAPQGGTRRG